MGFASPHKPTDTDLFSDLVVERGEEVEGFKALAPSQPSRAGVRSRPPVRIVPWTDGQAKFFEIGFLAFVERPTERFLFFRSCGVVVIHNSAEPPVFPPAAARMRKAMVEDNHIARLRLDAESGNLIYSRTVRILVNACKLAHQFEVWAAMRAGDNAERSICSGEAIEIEYELYAVLMVAVGIRMPRRIADVAVAGRVDA